MPREFQFPPRDLLREPLWRADDLGQPIADSPHAVSVCLPLWEHVVGYEEKEPQVLEALQCGYPRFVQHPFLKLLQEDLSPSLSSQEDSVLLLPRLAAAKRAQQYIGGQGRVIELTDHDGIAALLTPTAWRDRAAEYQRHTGEIISSRRAEAILGRRGFNVDGQDVVEILQARIATWAGAESHNVFLFENGMAAYFHLCRALAEVRGKLAPVQLGFPYTDILKVQQKFFDGGLFIADTGEGGMATLADRLEAGSVMAVFAEIPSNPLLSVPDLAQLARLCQAHHTPLIVDDTVGGFANLDILPWADAVISSLTKYISGGCDVMGGSIVLRSDSPFTNALKHLISQEAGIFSEDARVLEVNSRDYLERMQKINHTTAELVRRLRRHPLVDTLYFPEPHLDKGAAFSGSFLTRYEGAWGGLFSMVLVDPSRNAPRFYDHLRVNKGPSLGTNFTLACPYVLLAHYHELDWAEAHGVSRWLVRVSVGLEDVEDLWSRLDEALAGCR